MDGYSNAAVLDARDQQFCNQADKKSPRPKPRTQGPLSFLKGLRGLIADADKRMVEMGWGPRKRELSERYEALFDVHELFMASFAKYCPEPAPKPNILTTDLMSAEERYKIERG